MADSDLKKYHIAHGWLMMFGWGIFLPLGVLIARYTRDIDPWGLSPALWFRLHVSLQVRNFEQRTCERLIVTIFACVIDMPWPALFRVH